VTGWTTKRLGDLCSLRKDFADPATLVGDKYVALEHVDSGSSVLSRWGGSVDLRSTKSRFLPGNVLYGKLRPYLDKAVLAPWAGVCSTELLVLEPDEKEADPRFLAFLLHSSPFVEHAVATTTGVNHPRTSWFAISAFETQIPPRSEQTRIARVLALVEKAIGIEERLAEVLRRLKAVAMAKLFRDGLRRERLRDSEIGPIPESWDVVRIGQVCKIKSGGTPSRSVAEYWNGDIPWVKTTEVNYSMITTTEEHITKKGLDESSARLFPAGTLLMAMYGQGVTRGRVALLGIPATTNQACAAFFPDETVSAQFLYAYFTHSYENLRALGHGANQQNLSLDLLEQVWIPRPTDREEQEQIFSIVNDLQRGIEIATRKATALQHLLSSTLDVLMTGAVRLKDLGIAEVVNA
jgi:type I restriction enzyme, S subunit